MFRDLKVGGLIYEIENNKIKERIIFKKDTSSFSSHSLFIHAENKETKTRKYFQVGKSSCSSYGNTVFSTKDLAIKEYYNKINRLREEIDQKIREYDELETFIENYE